MIDTRALELLRVIGENIAGKTGEEFFRHAVREIASALDATYAFASRFNHSEHSAKVIAYWAGDHYEPFDDYLLDGTPCALVSDGHVAVFRDNLGEQFPIDKEWFEKLGVKSYLAIPVRTEDGNVCGHLAVMAKDNRDWQEADLDILRLFSLRAAGELERGEWEARLERKNQEFSAANDRLRLEILDRLRIESDLADAKIAAEAANLAKSTFLGNMSHELRTPLNGILGYVQLLLRDPETTASQRESLEVMRRSGQHLHELINEVLDLTKIEAGRSELRPAVTQLFDHLGNVVDVARVRAQDAGLSFGYEREPQVPSVVNVDAKALRQVLINLIGNAIKFTPRGGAVSLRVGGSPVDRDHFRLELEVEDSGIGIPQADLQEIFEPFYRVTNSGHTSEGTGLGLAISRRLVKQMGGEITVNSRVAEGSCFKIDIIIECGTSACATAPTATPEFIIGYTGGRRRILIVDDDIVSRDLLAKLLSSLGFVCRVAADGAEAISIMSQVAFDLVVTDLEMPVLCGRELLLKARAQNFNMPILAISASTSMGDCGHAVAEGFSDFLVKPWDVDQLLRSIASGLGLIWQYRAAAPENWPAAQPTNHPVVKMRSEFTRLLYHHAMSGDVNALMEALNDAHSGAEAALADEIRRLAKGYDLRAVRNVLEPLLGESPSLLPIR